MEISIKRISYLSMFGFTIVFALACASSGCVGSPDETADDDVAEPTEPDAPTVDPVDPPAPFACKAGATVEIGASNDWPALAGTDEGYALVYRDAAPSVDPTVLVFDREGEPTGPAIILPPSDYMPKVTGDSHGYAVMSGGTGATYAASIYRMGQDGTIGSVISNFWPGVSLDLTETKLRGFLLTYDPRLYDRIPESHRGRDRAREFVLRRSRDRTLPRHWRLVDQ